jgi:hypothetical protein
MSDSFSLRRACPEFRRISRRGLVHAGVLGTGGLSLGGLLRANAAEAPGGAAAKSDKSVILLWMRGGPSHIDMWDPKPDAPAEFRGEFGTIGTNVPGIQLTDMLPMSATMMDQWSIVRSLNHTDAGHSTGDQLCFTGYGPGPTPYHKFLPCGGFLVWLKLGMWGRFLRA